MNKLEIFKNEEFGEIRTALINNEPYFNLKDVCNILEIKNVSDCKSRLKKRWGRYYRGHRQFRQNARS